MSHSPFRRSVAALGVAVLATLAAGLPAAANPDDSSTSSAAVAVVEPEDTSGDPGDENTTTDPADDKEQAPAGGEAPSEGEAADETQEPGGDAEGGGDATDGEAGEAEGTDDGEAGEAEGTGDGEAAEAEETDVDPLDVDAPTTFTIHNITDFHGRISVAEAGRLACYMQDNPADIFTSSGDSIGGTTFTSASQNDYPTIEILNALGLDVSALGNHELDKGWADFWAKDTAATWPHLAANLLKDGEPVLDPYTVIEVDGVKVAFIGAVTEALPSLITPSYLDGYTIAPITDSVNAYAAQLKDGNETNGEADVVVALIHEGMPGAAAGLTNVDIVFGGHTHQVYSGAAESMLIMQAGQYGERVASVEVTVNPDGTIELAPTMSQALNERNNEYPHTCEGTIPAQIRAMAAEYQAEADEIGQEPLGWISADFNRAVQSDGSENRGGESTIGNLIADAQLWAASQDPVQGLDAEIAFMNPGGIRTDLKFRSSGGAGDEDGLVTLGEAAAVQPFGNTLITMELTGAQIINVLEDQWQKNADGTPVSGDARPFLKLGVAGLTYEYDPTTQTVTNVVLDSGKAFDSAATYKVVTNSFLASGGDNFHAFEGGVNVKDTGLIDLATFSDYLGEMASSKDQALVPDYTQRAVGVHDVAGNLDAATVRPGDEFHFELSSLLFSTTEPKSETVSVRFGTTVKHTFDIDPSIVDQYDEVGRATVRFTIPETMPAGDATKLDVTVTLGGQKVLSRTYEVVSEYTELAFYNITDFHGRIVEAAADLQCLMTDNPNAAFTSSGDNIGATTFVSAVANDIPTIDVLNAMGLDVSSLGNHELDKGWDDFYAKDDLANWPHVAANLFHADSMEPVLDTHVVLEVNGYQVAFVGAVPLTLPDKISPDILEGMVVTDPAAAMNEVAAELANNDEIDFIVGLMHDDAETFGTQLVGFDLAFGGDSHFTYEGTTADGAPLLQAGQYGEHLAYVSFSVDAEGTIVATHTELISLDGYSSTCGETEVTQIVAEAVAEASILGAEPIAEITADINRGQNSDGAPGGNRGTESTLGNLIADAHLWAAQQYGTDVDFAFMNPGGLRADLTYAASGDEGDGVVTYEEAANVQPFGNTLMTVDLLGEDIIGILLEQWQYNDDGTPKSRPFLALGVSGLTYEYDPASETILAVYLADGSPLDPAATYTVVANSFLAAGGDGFASFLEGTNVRDTGMIDLTATVSYLEAQDGPISPDYTQRSIGITDLGDSDSITTGDVIKLHISSLSFTTNEPKPTELTVMFDGQVLGTFPVDNTITDNLNETGQATIEVTVPDLSGYAEGDEVSFVIGYEDAEGNFVEVLHWVYEMDGKGGTPGKPGTDPGKPGKPGKPLPPTGADVGSMPLLAGGFVLLGAAALWGAQRRQDVTL